MNEKTSQRNKLKALRQKLSNRDVVQKSEIICESALKLLGQKKFTNIHVYLPIAKNKEVITWNLVNKLLEESVNVSTSVYSENKSLRHVRLQSNTTYILDSYGIPIPEENYTQGETSYDAVIVPVLGFDVMLHRIGYGMGVYDTFLSQQPNAYKIGLAYEFSKLISIKNETHDEKLDMIITEVELYN